MGVQMNNSEIGIEQLSKWTMDSGSQLPHYSSGDYSKAKGDGWNNPGGTRLELKTSV